MIVSSLTETHCYSAWLPSAFTLFLGQGCFFCSCCLPVWPSLWSLRHQKYVVSSFSICAVLWFFFFRERQTFSVSLCFCGACICYDWYYSHHTYIRTCSITDSHHMNGWAWSIPVSQTVLSDSGGDVLALCLCVQLNPSKSLTGPH